MQRKPWLNRLEGYLTMMMRSCLVILSLCLSLAASTAMAQQVVGTPQVAFGSAGVWPDGQSTKVNGKIPASILGTWLVLENLKLSETYSQPQFRLYRIKAGPGGQPESELVPFELPEEVLAEAVKSEGGVKGWQPTEKQLAVLRERANAATVEKTLRVKHYLDAKDKFDKDIARADQALTQANPKRKPTILAIRYAAQTEAGQVYSSNYFIEEIKPDMLTGATKVAAVPLTGVGVPLPVNFTGEAKLFRLDATPSAAAAAKPES